MARIELKDYMDIATKGMPTATSWQVALDKDFKNIIDESLENKESIYEWITPLPKIDNPDDFYDDLDELYCRVKLHIYDTVSDWFVFPVNTQKDYEINYIENGEIVDTVNINKLGENNEHA